jgi:hypothetical protein
MFYLFHQQPTEQIAEAAVSTLLEENEFQEKANKFSIVAKARIHGVFPAATGDTDPGTADA